MPYTVYHLPTPYLPTNYRLPDYEGERTMSKQPNKARHAKTPGAAPPEPDYAAALAAARPKVKELLAEYRADPTGDAGAIVETLMLHQVAGEPGREAELQDLQPERERHHALKNDSGRSATLARQNRQLRSQLVKQNNAQSYVRQYLEEVKTAARSGREPTQAEIIEKISAAIGLRGPLIPRVETKPFADAWNSRVAVNKGGGE
jgi:hypothetical protein